MNYIPWLISAALWLWLCLCLALPAHTVAGRYNISFAQLDTCDSYTIKEAGYAYRDFFMVHTLDNNQVNNNKRLHLKFYVLTSMDAHILLSVTNRLRPNDRVYEIVIGAGGNTFSAIRTAMGLRRVSTNQDRNLLSVFEPTPIEIVQTQDAELFVYIPGFKTEPLLQFMDASALTINYISFSSFGTNTARWFYDCSFDGFDKEISKETPALSWEQKLLADLIYQGENTSVPVNLTSIAFHFQARSIAYEQANALLRTRMHLMMHWQDNRLRWDPERYGQLKSFEHPRLEIWTPQLTVLNGAMDSLGEALKTYELRVFSDGNVTLYASNLELSSWCVDSARNWPKEHIACDVELGVLRQPSQSNIILKYERQRSPIAPNEHVNTPSDWTIIGLSVLHLGNDSASRYSDQGMLQTMAGDVAIEFMLQRNSSFYMTVFYMPLIACEIFIILSFVLRSTRRSALILIALLIIAWGLMYITRHASPHYVPALMSDYKIIMIVSCYCYILHICIMWLERYPPRNKAPALLASLINSNLQRCVLGLRYADSNAYCDIQEKPWSHLAKILNNLSFIGVCIAFAVMNVTSGV
ncbi:neuronal acetylcholine receptor subunit alpha-10 [Drosophila pseudoobscura]|uniref:Neuronal acetylcholine receptor subunit alpha-10 n=1 Tax=Drosophila pseudoobscura pseudoobscura TaxID=46245 RepID=A0A6I8UWN0_DROPS|nr:neuronal acetylcholine receptor subunit alpha-10 [Drosophila pseudoobscura]